MQALKDYWIQWIFWIQQFLPGGASNIIEVIKRFVFRIIGGL